MCGDDGDVSRLRTEVVERRVLLNGKLQYIFLGIRGCMGEAADMGCIDRVLVYTEPT